MHACAVFCTLKYNQLEKNGIEMSTEIYYYTITGYCLKW